MEKTFEPANEVSNLSTRIITNMDSMFLLGSKNFFPREGGNVSCIIQKYSE